MARIDVDMLKQTFAAWNADKASRLAAAISYTTVFAIAPLFVIVIAVAGLVLGLQNGGHGHHIVEDQLIGAVQSNAGTSAADLVRSAVDASYKGKASQGILAQVIGYITFVLAAMGLFASLQDALNTVWHVEPPKDKPSWLVQIRDRVASFGMVLGIGFLLLVTFAANAIIVFISSHVQSLLPFPGAGTLFAIVNWVVSVGIIGVLFAAMYKVLPDVKLKWHDVWLGGAVTAVLFVVGQTLIGLYLARAGVASAYGAAGALLVILVWVYYSAMIMLLGAEFTKIYAERHGSHAGAAAAAGAGGTAGARTATVRGDEPVAPPIPERRAAVRPPSTGRPLH